MPPMPPNLRALARRLLAVLISAAVLVPAAAAATTVTSPVYDQHGHLIQTPFAPTADVARLTKAQALAIVHADPKVKGWLARSEIWGLLSDHIAGQLGRGSFALGASMPPLCLKDGASHLRCPATQHQSW